jgi:hypothetical protein
LYLRSQELDNASWTATRATVANTALPLAPDGTATADALSEDGTSANDHLISQNVAFTSGTVYTQSVWARAGARTWLVMQLGTAGFSSVPTASFNLAEGTAGTITGTATTTITAFPNGWYRCTMTATATASVTAATRFYIGEQDNDASFDGLSQVSLYLWGAQIEPAGSAGVYTPTTTATAYTTSTGNCLGLLMEASKQNVVLNNANLSAGTWTPSNITISSSTSIDGTSRNIRIVEDSASAIHGIIAGVTITANTTYCLSAIVTPQGRQFAYMYGTNTDQFGAIFDFVNLTSAQILAGTSTINQRGIIPFGNGKFLIWVSGILNAASTVLNFVGGPATSLSVPGGYTYLGDGASGINMEYIQIELGSFPTSRIPTAGSAVTRAGDSCVRTLGAEFNASQGTLVLQGRNSGGQAGRQVFCAFSNGSVSDTIPFVRPGSSDLLQLRIEAASANQTSMGATLTNFVNFKAAGFYAINDTDLYINGGVTAPDTTVTLPTGITTLGIGCEFSGTSQCNGHVRSFRYYPKRESTAFLAREST